jgi:hypothetical protein
MLLFFISFQKAAKRPMFVMSEEKITTLTDCER